MREDSGGSLPGNGHNVEYGELEGQPVPGSDEGKLGLRQWIEDQGHELVVTTDREGDELYGELQDAEVLITTPFWPVYVTPEVMDQAPNLKLILTAGVAPTTSISARRQTGTSPSPSRPPPTS